MTIAAKIEKYIEELKGDIEKRGRQLPHIYKVDDWDAYTRALEKVVKRLERILEVENKKGKNDAETH